MDRITYTHDTGIAGGDTSPPVFGCITQIACKWDSDTGAAVQVFLQPIAGDTGSGFLIFNDPGDTGHYVRQPLAPKGASAAQSDTGELPYVAHGDRLRFKVTPKGAAARGKLHLWVG